MEYNRVNRLAVIARVLEDNKRPMRVAEILKAAGKNYPTRAKRPETLIAKDLSTDILYRENETIFARVGNGLYTLRSFLPSLAEESAETQQETPGSSSWVDMYGNVQHTGSAA